MPKMWHMSKASTVHLWETGKSFPGLKLLSLIFFFITFKHCACIFYYYYYSLYSSVIVYPNYIKATKGSATVGSNGNLLPVMQ